MDMITLAMAKAYSDKKGGYVEQGKMVFEADLNTTAEVPGIYQESGGRIGLEVGKTYTVQLDSGNYTAVCKEETKDGITARTLGNTSIYGEGEDTGESFLVSEVFTAEESVIVIVDRNQGTHAAIIDHDGETIHPIDPKYLPGVCLPVVELSEETIGPVLASGSAKQANEAEAAALIAAKDKGLCAICVCDFSGYRYSTVLNLLPGLDNVAKPIYKGDFGIGYVNVAFSNDGTVTLTFAAT